ncbi:hypothetical protein [Herbiconiux daphne]|uniref:Uncharacterized protein n=1 Tax=Herbiconiux daphne TaxID=2970914 RepID=A0ABT2H4V5_9MICO|nr:hypothetical protein [Herbiconiux daphne]MCS5734948.1 hypothetical protein [Herbiconiux daphne]
MRRGIVGRPDFTEFAVESNGGAMMTCASWEHVAAFPAEVSPANARPALDAGFEAVWKAIVAIRREMAKLSGSRDDLVQLPMSNFVLLRETMEAMA